MARRSGLLVAEPRRARRVGRRRGQHRDQEISSLYRYFLRGNAEKEEAARTDQGRPHAAREDPARARAGSPSGAGASGGRSAAAAQISGQPRRVRRLARLRRVTHGRRERHGHRFARGRRWRARANARGRKGGAQGRAPLAAALPSDGCDEPPAKPKPISVPQPGYTDDAQAAAIEGKVRVQLTVDETGKVRRREVDRRARPRPRRSRVGRRATRHVRTRPALRQADSSHIHDLDALQTPDLSSARVSFSLSCIPDIPLRRIALSFLLGSRRARRFSAKLRANRPANRRGGGAAAFDPPAEAREIRGGALSGSRKGLGSHGVGRGANRDFGDRHGRRGEGDRIGGSGVR